MSQGRSAFRLALEKFVWASLEVVIECFQSLLTLLDRLRQSQFDRQTVVLQDSPNDVRPPLTSNVTPVFEQSAIIQPVRMRPPAAIRVVDAAILQGRAQRYYAVAVGRQPGIYTSWREAAEQVIGYGGNIHRSFTNLAEAEFFLQRHRS